MIPETSWQQQHPTFPEILFLLLLLTEQRAKREKGPWQCRRNANKKAGKAKEVHRKTLSAQVRAV